MNKAHSRVSLRAQSIWRLVLPPLLVLVVVGVSILAFYRGGKDREALDADLCPAESDEISGSAVLLYDFTKPLRKDHASLPSNVLRDIGLLMERNHELRVFSLAASPDSPRTFLKRICKPYANSDLQIKTAKDQRGGLRACNDLPAQLPIETRESATAFCDQIEWLTGRIDRMVQTEWSRERRVQNAYLVEAMEDVLLDLSDRPQPHSIYVVSDLMQHAKWYSHLDDAWTNWSYEAFAELMAGQNWGSANGRGPAGKSVESFYIPREGLTDQPRKRQVHQNFWRDYFAGSEIAFHNQRIGPAYPFAPLMNVLTEAQQAAQERQVVEELLLQVREEQEALEKQRQETLQRLEAEQAQLEEERSRLRLLEAQQAEAQVGDDQTGDEPVEQIEAADGTVGEAPAAEQAREPPSTPAGDESGENADEADPGENADEADRVEDAAVQGVVPAPQPEPVELGRTTEPPDSTEQLADQEVLAQEAPALEQASQPTPATCRLRLSPQSGSASPDYPRGGRMNFGSALITVRYVVDAQGATIDDEVAVVAEESQSERERYFDLFAMEALATVRGWRFTFEESVEGACATRQSGTISFEFEYSYR